MTNEEILRQVLTLLNSTTPMENGKPSKTNDDTIEMLTIKECAQTIHGLSEHTVRQLVAQKKIPYIRTGQGKRGKILINKRALLDYLA